MAFEYDVYERKTSNNSCEKCQWHPKYILVTWLPINTLNGETKRFFMTTIPSFHIHGEPYLHYWGETSNGPNCLKDFVKIKSFSVKK